MIAAIDGFLKPLDWRLRWAMAAAFSGLALAIMGFGLRAASLGPWFLSIFCGLASIASVWGAQKTWTDKVPGAAAIFLERWKTARGKATKSGSGRFLWGLGRLAVGAFVASHAMQWIPGASKELGWVAMLGFGVSYGFFGLEAALWGMMAVAIVSHVGLSFGLGIDVSDPVMRRSFSESWSAGRSVSWFWAFAFAATPFCWIGVSAVIGRTKKSILRAAKKRKDESSAKRKIEARRLRLSGVPGIGGDTALDKARVKLEEAKSRLRSFDKGGTTTEGMDASASAESGKELTGVEKLENDNMIGTLRTYVAQVASIRAVEAQGLDVDTPARRGFDRVIMALGDSSIELMRKDQTGFYKDLLTYYLSLCEGEATVLRGSDGEIVTSVSMAPAFDEEDDIDGMSGSGWNVQSPPSDELGGLGDVMDEEDEIDVPPPPPTPPALPVQAIEPFDDDAPEEPEMMLAPSTSEPVQVDAENPLPLEDDVDEDATSSMHQENVFDPEAVEHDRDEDSDRGVEGAAVEPVEPMPAAVVEGGSVDEDGVRSGDVSPADKGPSEPEIDGSDSDDADLEGLDPTSDPVSSATSDATDEADAPVDGESMNDDRVPQESSVEGKAEEVSNEGVPSAAELKAAATKILMMRTTRDMVVSSAGWFSSTADLAAAMGIDDDDFSEPFDAYQVKVSAFALENQLRSLVATATDEADAERVDVGATALLEAGWDHDVDLIAEASARSEEIREAARVMREQEAAEIARAEQAAAEALAAALAAAAAEEAEAEEAALKIEQEAERVRLLAAAEIAAEAERIASDERSKALEGRRGKIAVQILLGRLTDAVVEDAIDLFDNAQTLADTLDIDLETAQERYDAFAGARDARLKYRELVAAFRAEDVSMVEALLKDETSFEGYTPTDMPIADIRKWAEGVRVRERLDGLVDGNKDVVETGGIMRRRFMMKRTGVTDALAAIVDEDLPRELRAAKSLRDAMKNLGDFVPEALLTLLADAEARAAVLARSLVDQPDPKMKIGEYAAAYLPKDVRVEGEDAWEMLVGMAATAVIVEPEPVVAPTFVDPAPQVPEVVAPIKSEEPAQIVNPDRIKMNTPIGFKGARTYEEVVTLNVEKELSRISKGIFSQEALFNSQRMALKGFLGSRTDQMVSIDDSQMYVSIPGSDGSIVGRVRIQAKSLAFAWFEKPDAIWFKDVETGDTKKVKAETVERQATPFLNAPNGDPETVIGFVLMSSLVTADGLTSVGPFVEKMGPRYTILGVNDSDGLCAFMRRMAEL